MTAAFYAHGIAKSSMLQLLDFVQQVFVEHADVRAFHAQGFGFNDAGRFEFAQRIDDYGAGYAHAVSDLRCDE